MADPTAARVNKDEWLAQHAALYGAHAYPDNALLHVSSKADFTGKRVPLDSPEAAWAHAARKKFTDIYIRVAPLNGNNTYAPGARGKKVDSLALPALWLDVDCAHGVHGSEKLPTMKEGGRIVRSVLAPSLIVKTGGGVHCYWTLDETYDWTSDTENLIGRWAHLWKSAFAAEGYHVDAGISRNVACVLRMAGTLNGKRDPLAPVHLVEADEPRPVYTVEDILAVAGPIPVAVKAQAAHHASVRRVGGPLAKKVNAALPVTALMQEVWGMEHLDSTRWSLPYSNGEHNPTGSAQVWEDDDDTTAVTAFSTRLQELWGQPDEAHALRTWDLTVACFGGDPNLAALVCRSLVHDPDLLLDAIVAAATTNLTPQNQ